jgi:hypothetical protein
MHYLLAKRFSLLADGCSRYQQRLRRLTGANQSLSIIRKQWLTTPGELFALLAESFQLKIKTVQFLMTKLPTIKPRNVR